ncbi:hypothetical protein GCK32_016452 [Trichostrongylus colubriformis]|uniref:Uncharacterized protein n=1 Tax=Trichostrongylus colubriformis TaxID=6319 RepID=A0AAN8F3P4_TRICO
MLSNHLNLVHCLYFACQSLRPHSIDLFYLNVVRTYASQTQRFHIDWPVIDECSATARRPSFPMRDDDGGKDDDEPPYSVRRLRQAYLERVRASTNGRGPTRRITPLAASGTPSLPHIPEDDEERRLSRSHRTTSESTLNRPEASDQSRARRFEPPPAPPPPPPPGPTYSQTAHSEEPVPRTNSERSQKRPSLIAVNVSTGSPVQQPSQHLKPREPSRASEGDDYPERLMSPPPTKEPRSIIKQGYYSSHQSGYMMQSDPLARSSDRPETSASQTYGDGAAYQSRSKPTNFNDLPEEERYRIMQENLERHRRGRAITPKPPTTSFNGPFFKLEEVNPPR